MQLSHEEYMKANLPAIIKNIATDYLWNSVPPQTHIRQLTDYEREYNSSFVRADDFSRQVTEEWNLCVANKRYLKVKLQQMKNSFVKPYYRTINDFIVCEFEIKDIDTFDKLFNAIQHLRIEV